MYRIPDGFNLDTALVNLSLRHGLDNFTELDSGIMIIVPCSLATPEQNTSQMSGDTCASEAILPAAELRAVHLSHHESQSKLDLEGCTGRRLFLLGE